jgi:hypothetical protein
MHVGAKSGLFRFDSHKELTRCTKHLQIQTAMILILNVHVVS